MVSGPSGDLHDEQGMGAPLFMTGVVNSVLFGLQYNIVTAVVANREGKVLAGDSAAELQRKVIHLQSTTSRNPR